jgi:hypothetical protein
VTFFDSTLAIPDTATLDLLAQDVASLGLPTGTAIQNESALGIAWVLAEQYLNTNILTGTVCEQIIFPTGYLDANVAFEMVQLKRTNLCSAPTILVHHELYNCACGTLAHEGCAQVYNAERSLVRIDTKCFGAFGGGTCWTSQGGMTHPYEADVCYVCGKWNTYGDIPGPVKFALGMLGGDYLGAMLGGGNISAAFVTSWRSMDYNETLGNVTKTILGSSPAAMAAAGILRPYRIQRAVTMRSHNPTRRR